MEGVKHFVLVHGFGHGAWCWYKLINLLKLGGHRVTALDLGACGIHPQQIKRIASAHDYLQPLMDFMASLPQYDRVVLVGHSYGGLCISLAMETFPEKILVAVFITAYMPDCTHPPATLIQEFFKKISIESLMDCRFSFDQGQQNLPTSSLVGPEYTATKDLELAKMLVRPNGLFLEDMGKESLLTEEKYGSISRVYVVCKEDEVMEEEFQRYVIET
ncbi:unnamed protein product [Ilex paraguariensis]|uniref:AB hydrolase-1 domain-containing protein n=1 Tax=Ilex paraguariensis TaxID=185542 RepID=A0ABC8SVF4_9AQUA